MDNFIAGSIGCHSGPEGGVQCHLGITYRWTCDGAGKPCDNPGNAANCNGWIMDNPDKYPPSASGPGFTGFGYDFDFKCDPGDKVEVTIHAAKNYHDLQGDLVKVCGGGESGNVKCVMSGTCSGDLSKNCWGG